MRDLEERIQDLEVMLDRMPSTGILVRFLLIVWAVSIIVAVLMIG